LPANARTRDALEAASNADIVTVLTAGNDGTGLDGLAAEIGDPRYSGAVLVVGSFDRDADDLAANSNIATIEGTSDVSPAYIAAPGAFVCIATDDTGAIGEAVSTCGAPAAPGDDGAVSAYRYRGGTSYSAPQVAGAAALIRQSRPDLSASEVVQIIIDSAGDLGAAGYDGIYGAGLLNVAAALDAAAAAP
jgi:subtilisin family serine protease